MNLTETLELSLKVLSDWRVDAVTIAFILAWAALRYVGSVYRRRPPRAAMRGTAARAVPKASAPAPGPEEQ